MKKCFKLRFILFAGALLSIAFVSHQAKAITCPLTTGQAYKTSSKPATYYVTEDCTKRSFANGTTFFTYFKSWSDVKTTTQSKLDQVPNDALGFMPKGKYYDPKYGALVKTLKDPKVYLLLGTEKYWITNPDVFTGLKYDWDWIEDVDQSLLDKYTVGSEINYTNHHPNFTLVKYDNDTKVYRLEADPKDSTKQIKKHVPDEATFDSLGYRWDRIVIIKTDEAYTDGGAFEAVKKSETVKTPVTETKTPETPASDTSSDNLSDNPNGVKTVVKATGIGNSYGKDIFIVPQGATGEWLFAPQIEFIRNNSCKSGASYPDSTGAEYDNGVRYGMDIANYHMNLFFPVNDSTAPAGKSKDFQNGYKYGYINTQKGFYVAEVSCPTPKKLSDFNMQGWQKEKPSNWTFSFLKPPFPHTTSVKDGDNKSMLYFFEYSKLTVGKIKVLDVGQLNLGASSKTGDDYNKDKKLNTITIHLAELDTSKADPGKTIDYAYLKEMATDYYNYYVKVFAASSDYNKCTFDGFDVEEKTYNGQVTAHSAFFVNCPATKISIMDGIESSESQIYFTKLKNNHIAVVYFMNSQDVTTNKAYDDAKLSDKTFREQFMKTLSSN